MLAATTVTACVQNVQRTDIHQNGKLKQNETMAVDRICIDVVLMLELCK